MGSAADTAGSRTGVRSPQREQHHQANSCLGHRAKAAGATTARHSRSSVAWIRAAGVSLLLFHECRRGSSSRRAPADACSSSAAGARPSCSQVLASGRKGVRGARRGFRLAGSYRCWPGPAALVLATCQTNSAARARSCFPAQRHICATAHAAGMVAAASALRFCLRRAECRWFGRPRSGIRRGRGCSSGSRVRGRSAASGTGHRERSIARTPPGYRQPEC